MPFVYDLTNIEGPEQDDPDSPPSASQFVYLPAPDYSGVHSAVQFSILPIEPTEPEPPIVSAVPQPRSILDRLLGRGRLSQERRQISFEEERRRSRLRLEQRRQQVFAIMVPALRAIGLRTAYCRYDGGSDEGFAWLDRYETEVGQKIDADVVAKQLYELNIHEKLCAAGFKDHIGGTSSDEQTAGVKSFATGWLPQEWAELLLGRGFGTGEYTMYGAFTVDLDDGTITDDPHAEPVVANIAIAT